MGGPCMSAYCIVAGSMGVAVGCHSLVVIIIEHQRPKLETCMDSIIFPVVVYQFLFLQPILRVII